jgi:hypothetical protein
VVAMSTEGELLRRLQTALARADVDGDVVRLVSSAWEDARKEVGETLRRLMVRELLSRSHHLLCHRADPDAATASPGAAPREGSERGSATHGRVLYLFAITRGDARLPEGLPVLPGASPVESVPAAGLQAIVCRIESSVLDSLQDPDPADLEVLAAAARAHDTTLAACAREATVLPLRLGTVIADEESVRALLEDHATALRDELDRLEGHAEWTVTFHLPDAPASQGDGDQSGGRAYMESRRAALQAKEQRRHARRALAEEAHTRLAAAAAAAQVIGAKPVPEIAPPLLHGAYLVHDRRRASFEAAVEELREQHPEARVDLAGPWPPYHFTHVCLGEAGDAA